MKEKRQAFIDISETSLNRLAQGDKCGFIKDMINIGMGLKGKKILEVDGPYLHKDKDKELFAVTFEEEDEV